MRKIFPNIIDKIYNNNPKFPDIRSGAPQSHLLEKGPRFGG